MNVIWFCNSILPKLSDKLGVEIIKPESWITALYSSINKNGKIRIIYVYPAFEEKNDYIDGCNNIFMSYNKKDDKENRVIEILRKSSPDIIHLFGTENPDALCFIEAVEKCNLNDKVVISIQGILSAIAEHYTIGLPVNIIQRYTIRDFIRKDNIRDSQNRFFSRAKSEHIILNSVSRVIGRTEFDYALTKQINPKIKYYHCNESLRDSFYNGKWSLDKCQRHSIFVSQSNYPIKGFHIMIKAISEILKKYPDVVLYTTGSSPLTMKTKDRLLQTSYTKYLRELIKQYKVEDHIVFLGRLDEKQMLKQYLNAHIFISCSTIENSPNSIGEAMMLGVPCISSDVGGVKNFIQHNYNGYLYQCDAYYMISYYVSRIFDDNDIALEFSKKSINKAKLLYDKELNTQRIVEIYKDILQSGKGQSITHK